MTSKSAAKLLPSDPAKVMVFRDLLPNLTTLSTPFARGGHVKIGGRATIVKLQTGSLAVFSPVALTDDVKAKVASMGNQVRYISAMDIEHHIFLSPWANHYPDAAVIGMEGLPEKREKDGATRGLRFAHVFTKSNKRDMSISAEFDAEFEYEYMDSHINRELIFYHKPTKTMIEADLLFNLPAHEQYSRMADPQQQTQSQSPATTGWMTRMANAMMHTRGDAIWQRRFMWYLASARDRPGFADSIARMSRWDLQRIIPSHGDVVESAAQDVFDKTTVWHRESQDRGRKD